MQPQRLTSGVFRFVDAVFQKDFAACFLGGFAYSGIRVILIDLFQGIECGGVFQQNEFLNGTQPRLRAFVSQAINMIFNQSLGHDISSFFLWAV